MCLLSKRKLDTKWADAGHWQSFGLPELQDWDALEREARTQPLILPSFRSKSGALSSREASVDPVCPVTPTRNTPRSAQELRRQFPGGRAQLPAPLQVCWQPALFEFLVQRFGHRTWGTQGTWVRLSCAFQRTGHRKGCMLRLTQCHTAGHCGRNMASGQPAAFVEWVA